MGPSDPLGDFINEKLAAQERRDQYGFGAMRDGLGLKASVGDWNNATSRLAQAYEGGSAPGAEWKEQQITQLLRAGNVREAADLRAADVRMTSEGLRNMDDGSMGFGDGDKFALKPPILPPSLLAPPTPQTMPTVPTGTGLRIPPWAIEAGGWAAKAGIGLGLLTFMKEPFTTKWEAAGASFSYNQDDFTLRINDGDTGTRLAVPGIHNPSQYNDAQYLAYVTYKANGGQLNINDYVSVGAPDGVGLSISKARGFDVTDAVTISGRRAIDLGKSYEAGVRALYGNEVSYEDRSYRTIVNGKLVDGVADHVIVRGGQQIAVEAKYVEDWNKSLRNPDGSSGSYPWSVRAQQEMVNQASKYSSFFDGGVIYHTNSSELATHYTNLFEKLGVQNFRFVITPANRK